MLYVVVILIRLLGYEKLFELYNICIYNELMIFSDAESFFKKFSNLTKIFLEIKKIVKKFFKKIFPIYFPKALVHFDKAWYKFPKSRLTFVKNFVPENFMKKIFWKKVFLG